MAKATAKKAAAKTTKKVVTGGVFSARAVTEITASFKDTPGLSSKVAAAVAAKNVNILAATGHSANTMYRMATFNLIVNDFSKAEEALEDIGATDIDELSVVLVDMDNKVGALERATKIIADAGINIYYFYATTSTGRKATCILKTEDDKKTIKLLNKAK